MNPTAKKIKNILRNRKCSGIGCSNKEFDLRNDAEKFHICPFQEEINHDDESLCDCCADCEQKCRWEI